MTDKPKFNLAAALARDDIIYFWDIFVAGERSRKHDQVIEAEEAGDRGLAEKLLSEVGEINRMDTFDGSRGGELGEALRLKFREQYRGLIQDYEEKKMK